jgi:PAS domain S-box-containing protein
MGVDQASTGDDLADPEFRELLTRLVDGSFVLVNPDGSITRWGPRPEALFGWTKREATGRPISETLLAPPAGEAAWHELLDGTEARVQIEAAHKDGHRFRCDLYLIPIRLSDGLAFNVFLQELESDLSREWKLRRIPRAHEQVVGVLAAALRNGPRFGEEERLAGAIVAFRPIDPAPWLETALRAAEGALAGGTRPTATGEAERLAMASRSHGQLEEARREADAARAEAAAARAEAAEAVARIGELAREAAAAREDATEARRLAEEARARAPEPAEPTLAEELEDLKRGLDAARAESARLREESEGAGREHPNGGALRGAIEEIHRGRSELERLREAATSIRLEAEEARRTADEAGARAGGAAAEVQAAVAEAREARAAAEAARDQAAEARATLEAALADAEEARSQAAAAASEARESRAAADEARARADSAVRELAGARERLMADISDSTSEVVAPVEPTSTVPRRPMREGFDDVPTGMAVIGLDGHFKELNPRFSELIGYTEEEFRAASWPSIGDHEHLAEHRELMRALLAGERDEAHVETYYMGGSGLLVAITGQIRVVRDETGEPDHLLLTVDEPVG